MRIGGSCSVIEDEGRDGDCSAHHQSGDAHDIRKGREKTRMTREIPKDFLSDEPSAAGGD